MGRDPGGLLHERGRVDYLTEPFVFTYPGVEAREVEPWDEDGETWRRLAVTFPPTIANHNPDQVFYYDESFMQRRMDYSPDVTANPPIAHYTHDPKTFDGFVFPTRRRVRAWPGRRGRLRRSCSRSGTPSADPLSRRERARQALRR